jgi:hypothetical protein
VLVSPPLQVTLRHNIAGLRGGTAQPFTTARWGTGIAGGGKAAEAIVWECLQACLCSGCCWTGLFGAVFGARRYAGAVAVACPVV